MPPFFESTLSQPASGIWASWGLTTEGMVLTLALFSIGLVTGSILVWVLLRRSTDTEPVPASHELELNDLLDRPPVSLQYDRLRGVLKDKTVLVTGAGGSIGSELSQILSDLTPRRLVLVDINEHNLYRLEQRLPDRADEVVTRLVDVSNSDAVHALFATTRPDVVIHAAAYKHVPLMERHPSEAFQNNTLSTAHLLHACEAFGTEQFVLISTDKAVSPSGVLGVTKQLAEWYVRAFNSDLDRKIVRFGNVFGSRGSVVPLFERQLSRNEPLTITHPEMERYFMTAQEACSLILETLLLHSHSTYIFRMGDPVPIRDLAATLIVKRTGTRTPERFMRFVGLRPGEKLSEDLIEVGEAAESTAHESIMGIRSASPMSRSELDMHFRHLQDAMHQPDVSTDAFRDALFRTNALHRDLAD